MIKLKIEKYVKLETYHIKPGR